MLVENSGLARFELPRWHLAKPNAMQLPNANSAIVPREKVVDYLLNPRHPDGAAKSKFFESLGFRIDEWQYLANSLLAMVRRSPVAKSMESVHGRKYIIDGEIETPIGIRTRVRSVWIADGNSQIPRLVTAYPRREET